MTDLTFETKLVRPEGVGTWTFASISKELANQAQLRARMRVKGDDRRFPIQVVSKPAGDGDVFIVVNKELRDKIGKGSGEVVEMTVGRDTSAVVVSIPADVKKALSQNAKAETSFRKMAPSHRKAYVQWIEQAKKAETRESRLKKAIDMLLQGKTMS
jgi:Bacteriocin-protection, YdeI or OmpD-Associated/Domain of unknown function (DUF1905)